jgi:hypothetical protein
MTKRNCSARPSARRRAAWIGGVMGLGLTGLGMVWAVPAARAQAALPPPDDGSIYTM